jgi:hypothetical protein
MTISLWCKGNSQYGALISKFIGCSSDNGWQLHTMEGKVSTYSYNFLGGAYLNCDGDSNTIISDNNWYNVVSTYDLSGVKMYVNNVLVLTKPYIGNGSMSASTNIQDVYIGKEINSNNCSPYNTFYQGRIDDIGIWNRVLTQQEITAMYNGVNYNTTCNIIGGTLVNGLVGYWPFCGNANDESGNGNNGTVNGATLTTDRFGNADRAYSFDGISNIITTNNFINPLVDWSCSFWFLSNNSSTFNQQNIVGFGQNSPTFGGPCYQINGGIAPVQCPEINSNLNKMSFSDSTYECGTILYSNQSINNVWYFVTVKKQSTVYSLYVNGILINSGNLNNITLTNLSFGNRSQLNFQYFNGKIDDIGVWNRALTQQEITDLYTNNLSANSFESPKELITIYPNPTNSKISIDCSLQSNLIGSQVKISTILGQEIYNSKINQLVTEIQLSSIASSGVYFVQIINAQGQIVDVKKILLQ